MKEGRIEMPCVTDREIEEGFLFEYKEHVFVALVPDDDGHACGYDTESGVEYDLRFVWTCQKCWVFVEATEAFLE